MMKSNYRKKLRYSVNIIAIVALFTLQTLLAQSQGTIFPGLTGQELITKLQQEYKPATVLSYDNARDTMFAVIDNHNGQVTGVYSGYTITLDPNADPSSDAYNKDMNTEHTWPQSMGADVGNAHSDLHHLYPVRVEVNSSRGNDPFAEINDSDTDTWWRNDYSQSTIPTSYIDEYSEKDNSGHFEPREDHKGNAARAVFYFYTMYQDQADSDFFNQQKDILRVWNIQDTVDQAERDRSHLVAQYQDGKENPFILDTTLVRRAYFSDDTPPAVANPTNFAASAVSASEIDLSWTRNADHDDVMIVWNTTGTFNAPADSTTYSDGQSALGGTIIGRRADTTYVHSGLTTGTTYYYRAFSVHGAAGSEQYSGGTDASATPSAGGAGDAQPGDIVITEIMQNPSAVYDADGEWFEVYNASDHSIDLNGWYLKDNDTDQHQINNGGALIIEPNAYMVLGNNADQVTNGGVQEAYQYSSFTLANGADEVVLLLADGVTEIDRVEYDGGSLWPDPNGASMYYTGDVSANNNDGVLWSTSTFVWAGSAGDKGSPGYSDQTSDVITESPVVAKDFALSIYPNPFNPSTAISYQLSAFSYVELSVFNIIGQKVRTLFSGRQTAGKHQAHWNGLDANGRQAVSGIYFVELRAGTRKILRKITLLR